MTKLDKVLLVVLVLQVAIVSTAAACDNWCGLVDIFWFLWS